jgi:hypothetical protein
MSNIFKDFHDAKSRIVWFPGYTPLWQKVLKEEISKEEAKKKRRRDYMREYYAEHRERICKQQRDNYKKRRWIEIEDIKNTHQILIGKWYLDELADKINAWLITQNKELYEENQKLKEQLHKIDEFLDQIISNK